MDEDSENIKEKARKLIIEDEKLKLVYERGEISKAEFEEKHNLILEKLDALKKRKVQMESEKNRLLAELLHLRGELKEGRIDDDIYARRFSEIQGKLESIEHPDRQLKIKKGIPEDTDYYIFPRSLWIILIVFATISIGGLVLVTIGVSSVMSSIPAQFKGMLLSYLLLVPIVLIIGVLIRAAILWVGAYIASIEEVTYSKGITCAVAEVIVLSGSSIIFSLLSIDFFFMGGSIGLITPISWILLILRFLLVASLSVWIIKSVFYTTYTKAVITWIVSIIIGVVIYLIMIALFGLAFYM